MPIYMNGKIAGSTSDQQTNVNTRGLDLHSLLALLSQQAGAQAGKQISNQELDDMSSIETIRALAKAAGTVENMPKLNSKLGQTVVISAEDKQGTLDLLADL